MVIGGEGDCFTAGNDLKDFLQNPMTSGDAPPIDYLRTLITMEKPVVAAVHGLAIGIGTTMLLHCDLVYAAHDARFHLPFVNLGLVPEAGSSLVLPAMMGHQRAAGFLMLGEPFSAREAADAGIVTEVVDPSELWERARSVAAALAARPPEALRLTKRLMTRASRPAILEAMDVEVGHFQERLRSPEAREAMQAILEKRPPKFGP